MKTWNSQFLLSTSRSCLLIGLLMAAGCGQPGEQPKLIVVVVVDQMKYNYLSLYKSHFGDRGFRRLMRDGAFFTNAKYQHGTTHTAAGHATIMSGLHPSSHGIIANHWYDRTLKRRTYAAEDTAAAVIGSNDQRPFSGRSPRRLASANLCDDLQDLTHAKAGIFSVSNKDRSAIFMGGKRPDGVYWFREEQGGVFSSKYYFGEMPRWVEDFNRSRPTDKYFGRVWEAVHTRSLPFIDDYRLADNPFDHAGFPYSLRGKDSLKPDERFYKRVIETPFASDLLLDFVDELVKHESPGADNVTDILCISFSSNDFIGHSFGPASREVAEITIQTDLHLARLFDIIEKKVNFDDVLWVLTSDHGVAPFPEHERANRVRPLDVKSAVEEIMIEKYGKSELKSPFVLAFQYPNLYLNDRLLEEKKIDKEGAVVYISQSLVQKMQSVERVFPRSALMDKTTPEDSLVTAVRNGYRDGRSGDAVVVLKPFSIWSSKKVGAEHSLPYVYDAHVPLIIAGKKWIKGGTYEFPCSPADIAPTLASVLKLETSYRFDGRVLEEVLLPSPKSP